MSTTTTEAGVVAAVAPVSRRVRAYFAPVNRSTGVPTLFDAAQQGRFDLHAPPAPWIDLGWISGFARNSATKVDALRSGAPAMTVGQARTEVEATVSLEFETWGRLQGTLASGSQQTNLLATESGATLNGSGGVAAAPIPLLFATTTTATTLNVGAAATAFSVGSLVAVDVDYTGQLGYVGAGVSAAYVQSASAINSDVNYVRRVTLNVGVVTAIANGILTLSRPLISGVPTATMQVSQLVGFCDREGASFFQEWSALFVMQGVQGDRVLIHYPRLQAMQASSEKKEELSFPLEKIRPAGVFRALPVKDANDSENVLCFRSYLPAALRDV